MGRPAINTALIPASPVGMPSPKDAFNAGIPSTDVANFTSTVVATLLFFGTARVLIGRPGGCSIIARRPDVRYQRQRRVP